MLPQWAAALVCALLLVAKAQPPQASKEPHSPQAIKEPPSPQAITWLYARNLTKASRFLEDIVGLPMVFDGGAVEWKGCKVHTSRTVYESGWFIGVCDIRAAPDSMAEASVTVTLVAESREGVDQWHGLLSMSPSQINVTTPHNSTSNCYAFNFYDTSLDSLGFYHFVVQVFEDPSWPAPQQQHQVANVNAPAAPQQVTWLYTSDLKASTSFLVNVLHFPIVLDQGPCTIHAHPEAHQSFFVGVCDSQPAPTATPPVTFTIVVRQPDDVRAWHALLTAGNATNATSPALVPRFNVFAFEFFDWDKSWSLGWYRLSCQSFGDPSWPHTRTTGVESQQNGER